MVGRQEQLALFLSISPPPLSPHSQLRSHADHFRSLTLALAVRPSFFSPALLPMPYSPPPSAGPSASRSPRPTKPASSSASSRSTNPSAPRNSNATSRSTDTSSSRAPPPPPSLPLVFPPLTPPPSPRPSRRRSSFRAATVAQARVALDHFLSDVELVVQTLHRFAPHHDDDPAPAPAPAAAGTERTDAPSLEVGLEGSWEGVRRR